MGVLSKTFTNANDAFIIGFQDSPYAFFKPFIDPNGILHGWGISNHNTYYGYINISPVLTSTNKHIKIQFKFNSFYTRIENLVAQVGIIIGTNRYEASLYFSTNYRNIGCKLTKYYEGATTTLGDNPSVFTQVDITKFMKESHTLELKLVDDSVTPTLVYGLVDNNVVVNGTDTVSIVGDGICVSRCILGNNSIIYEKIEIGDTTTAVASRDLTNPKSLSDLPIISELNSKYYKFDATNQSITNPQPGTFGFLWLPIYINLATTSIYKRIKLDPASSNAGYVGLLYPYSDFYGLSWENNWILRNGYISATQDALYIKRHDSSAETLLASAAIPTHTGMVIESQIEILSGTTDTLLGSTTFGSPPQTYTVTATDTTIPKKGFGMMHGSLQGVVSDFFELKYTSSLNNIPMDLQIKASQVGDIVSFAFSKPEEDVIFIQLLLSSDGGITFTPKRTYYTGMFENIPISKIEYAEPLTDGNYVLKVIQTNKGFNTKEQQFGFQVPVKSSSNSKLTRNRRI